MWSRLSKDDFLRTKELRSTYDLSAKGWGVCEDYEIEEVPSGEQYLKTPEGWVFVGSTRIVPKYPISRHDKWTYYDPVNDTPDLFLRFARLNEGPLLPDSIRGWVRRYGLLGLNNHTDWVVGYWDPEYTEAINEMTKLASAVLKGYEAVLNSDSDAAKRIIFNNYSRVFSLDWSSLRFDSGFLTIEKQDIAEAVEQDYDGDYTWYLLECCAEIVQEMVRAHSWPALSVEGKPRRPVSVVAGWSIRNLLGAMYLQMYRLMAAGEEVTTCRYCGRVISLLESENDDRKPRQDKKYCDDACRQRFHYHNRVKPRRQKR
jgi:hypothetical protein